MQVKDKYFSLLLVFCNKYFVNWKTGYAIYIDGTSPLQFDNVKTLF